MIQTVQELMPDVDIGAVAQDASNILGLGNQPTEDAQVMQQQLETQTLPTMPPQEEMLTANLSAWGARKLLKSVRPNIKEASKEYLTEIVKKTETQKADTLNQKVLETTEEIPSIDAQKEAADLVDTTPTLDSMQSHQVNFKTFEGKDDVQNTLSIMADKNKDKIDEARRGVITDEQLNAFASEMGADPKFISDFMSRELGRPVNAEEILAARQLLEQSAIKLKNLALEIKTGNAGQQTQLDFVKQWSFHSQFQKQFMGARAEIGRALRAIGVPTGSDDLQSQRVQEVLNNFGAKMDINSLADDISKTSELKGLNKMVDTQTETMLGRMGNAFFENFVASILSGVTTQVKNTVSSGLRLAASPVDNAVAGVMGFARGGEDKVYIDEFMAEMFGMYAGFSDALLSAKNVVKTGEQYGGMQKFESFGKPAISSEALGIKKTNKINTAIASLVDVYGEVARIPVERFMGGTDAFFKVISERGRLAQLAYRKVRQSGLDGQAQEEMLNELLSNPTPDMVNEAIEAGLEHTFQKPLGETGQALQKFANRVPGARIFMPFIKTPANLMKQGFLERTPLGFFAKQYREDLLAGGARGDLARAKLTVGTGIGMFSYYLASQGLITGEMPTDPRTAAARKATGWRPLSYVVKDDEGNPTDYIPMVGTEPFSYIFGAMATYHDFDKTIAYDDISVTDEERLGEQLSLLLVATSQSTINKSFMTGARDFMEASSNPWKWKRIVANIASGQVPYSALQRDLSRVWGDVNVKEGNAVGDYFRKNLPLLFDQPTMLDAYGDEVKYDRVLNPWESVARTDDKVKLEVNRLLESTLKTAIGRPRFVIGGKTFTAQERHDFIKLSRKELKEDGKNFYETVKETINTPEYKDLLDDAKIDVLRNIQLRYDAMARDYVQYDIKDKRFDKLRERVIKSNAFKQSKKTGEDPMGIYSEIMNELEGVDYGN